MDDLVDTTEMYLKSVLEMEEAEIDPLRARIAERLEQSPPTVSQTVARMERNGLLDLSSADRRLSLTGEGRRQAVRVMRKHRIAECFLNDVVELDWSIVHQEACRWEHVMSDETLVRMDALLGHPVRSPYGNPVPPADDPDWLGLSRWDGAVNLVRLTFDGLGPVVGRIEWIGEGAQAEPDMLAILLRSGVLPGVEVEFERHGPSILVHPTDSGLITELPHQLAGQLFVAR